MQNQVMLHSAFMASDMVALDVLAERFRLDVEVLKEVSLILADHAMRGCTISPIQASVMQGNYQLCKCLLAEGGSLFSSAPNVPPPLILALQNDKYEIARLLVQSGANVSLAYKSKTPMYYALKKNTPEYIVEEILRAGFPVDGRIEDTYGMTSLHRAVACDNFKIVNLLIQKGVNVNATNTLNMFRPIHVAVKQGFFHLIEILVANGALLEEECKEGYTPLFLAIQTENVKLVERLQTLGANVLHLSSVKMIYPLNFAVSLGNRKIVQFLLQRGAGVRVECPNSGNLPIHDVAASQVGKELEFKRVGLAKIASVLIENGSEVEPVNKLGLTPMKLAIMEQNFPIVQVLVREGADIAKEMDQATYFHMIAKFAKSDVLETVLEWGGDWSMKDKFGLTVYNWAKLNSNPNVLQVFFKYGCPLDLPVEITDQQPNKSIYHDSVISVLSNQNLFLSGIRKGDVEMMKAALVNGAVATGRSCDMLYPLHFAVENGSSSVVLFMLEQGVSPNCFDNNGETPLHAAVCRGDFLICIYLLSYGACFTAPAKKSGKTPLDFAMEYKKYQIKFLLKEIQVTFDSREDRHVRTLNKKLKRWKTDPRLLLAFLNTCNSRGETLMAIALRKKLYTLADSIMEFRIDPEGAGEEVDVSVEPKVEQKRRRQKKNRKFVRNQNTNTQPFLPEKL